MQIHLLDMKRSMNVNIFLKQFKLPNDDIIRLIVEGNHEAIGQEKLKGLLKALPEKEEVCVPVTSGIAATNQLSRAAVLQLTCCCR